MHARKLALAIIAAGVGTQAMAGGFALNEQSVSAGGTANAGRASNVLDASVVYNNPAAMVKLKQAQFTQALAFIDAQTDISGVTAPLGGTSDGDIVPHTFVPSGFFTSGDQGGWAWGVAAYGSFGLKTNHEDSYAGRHLGDKSSVKVMTLQPTVSYALNDKVRVGAGVTFNYLDAYLSKNVSSLPNIGGGAPGTVLGTTELEGDDYGYGYNLGIHADLTESTTAGLVYRSKVKYKIDDGSLTTSGTGVPVGGVLVGAAGKYDGKTALTTPESVELSLSQRLTDATSVHAGATWTRWSRLKDLVITTSHPLVPVTTETFEWKDAMGYAVGITHAVSDKLELRAGLAYDNSPVTAEHMSPRLPSGDRRIFSVGAGYQLSPTQTIDFSYTNLNEEKVQVNQPASAYVASFKNSASIYGLQFTQKF